MSYASVSTNRELVKSGESVLWVSVDTAMRIRSCSLGFRRLLAGPYSMPGEGDSLFQWFGLQPGQWHAIFHQAEESVMSWTVRCGRKLYEEVETHWRILRDSDESVHCECLSHHAGREWGVAGEDGLLCDGGMDQGEAVSLAERTWPGISLAAVPLLEPVDSWKDLGRTSMTQD